MSVLVVDDSAANRMVLRALLQRMGHEALVAADAIEARRLFSAERPETVLTDLHLGSEEDGLALAGSLRQLAGEAHVRIGLMTADAPSVSPSDGLIDALLEKPVALETLKSFLEGGVQ